MPQADSYEERLDRGASLLRNSSRAVAFTGAGISTESGISDFRSPGGVWERHRVVTYQEFIADPHARREYWTMKKELQRELGAARPNPAHIALAELQKEGKLGCLITQNIDGLHQDAGSPPGDVVELHGTNRRAHCLGCGRHWRIEEIQERLERSAEEPRCEDCGEIIKPATVMFGQAMPEEEMARAFRCAGECDLFIMIGSSLQVEPAASVPRVAHEHGAALIYINRTPTPTDRLATLLFREPAGATLEALVARYREHE